MKINKIANKNTQHSTLNRNLIFEKRIRQESKNNKK